MYSLTLFISDVDLHLCDDYRIDNHKNSHSPVGKPCQEIHLFTSLHVYFVALSRTTAQYKLFTKAVFGFMIIRIFTYHRIVISQHQMNTVELPLRIGIFELAEPGMWRKIF